MTEADLVERTAALLALRSGLDAATASGHIVLLSGEAGIGKTSVMRAFAARLETGGQAAVWWGACDALQTPHPLAPLLDMARHKGTRFGQHLDGPRPILFEAVFDEMSSMTTPVVLVVEDVHWADEATLDLLKFLGRRIERTHALLVLTYRDDEVSASHPLRRLLGELPSSRVTRIALERLSVAGVGQLAQRALRAPGQLFEATQGNPFFLNELLRHSGTDMPRSVQDLVLARFGRMSKPAQAVVRMVAIAPGGLEIATLDEVLSPQLEDIEASIDGGLVIAEGAVLRFRHELARGAVEASASAPLARTLHVRLLRALQLATPAVSAARLVHHASRAGDDTAVRRHALVAAEEATRRGAHREAAGHYQCLSSLPDKPDDGQRLARLEATAEACQRIDRFDAAIAARQALDTAYRAAGEVENEGRNLSRLALLYVQMLRLPESDAASRRAIELLEALPGGPALAAAYGTEASLRMLNRDCAESAAWAEKSIELAAKLGDRARVCMSSSTLGTALMFGDYERGRRQLEDALAMAITEELPLVAGTALLNLGSASGELMRIDAATLWLHRAIDFAAERELDTAWAYSSAWLALCEMLHGRWAASAARASEVLARSGASTIARVMALLALGRVRLRRGDPGVDDALDEALALAGTSNTLQRVAPVRAARAEAAHARGDLVCAGEEASAALPLAIAHQHPWFIGELALWSWRAGLVKKAPVGCAEPYALQIDGDWVGAAAAWRRHGCPYEEARALADGDVAARKRALAMYEELGARPAATALQQQLRADGVRGLPRGARASTREQTFGLTTRELQVLGLVCQGLRNAEIAARLSRSVRTVDHHVAAVCAKLGVDSRGAAVHAALRAGIGPDTSAMSAGNVVR